MGEINTLFRKRIGFSENDPVTFESLDEILKKAANAIPFENLCIIANQTEEITEDRLIDKIIHQNKGGLCYELNPLLHLFLLDNGFEATMIRGVVYNHLDQSWTQNGRTHVTNLVTHRGETFLVDTGFGSNLPLRPVPLKGGIVSSSNGEFQVKQKNSEYGDYILEIKIKNKDSDWKIGYAFDTKEPVLKYSELSDIQRIIATSANSPFNKSSLVTQVTENGSITLTDTSLTEWENGWERKEAIDRNKFREILADRFGLL